MKPRYNIWMIKNCYGLSASEWWSSNTSSDINDIYRKMEIILKDNEKLGYKRKLEVREYNTFGEIKNG